MFLSPADMTWIVANAQSVLLSSSIRAYSTDVYLLRVYILLTALTNIQFRFSSSDQILWKM
jgi:hypothetical protein